MSRFYPSIYTHSIPWALHGKSMARSDKDLYGNKLDKRVRETQDKQTGGIPIGPDTSFLIGEVIGTAIDIELQQRLPHVKGTRYIDDFHLYFESLADCESALAVLHKVVKEFELEINDQKTDILSLPESFEPAWKAELRAIGIRPSGSQQRTDLLELFNRAFELGRRFQNDSVLTYAAKQVLSADIDPDNWALCESLLLRSTVGEPTMLPVLIEICEKNVNSITDQEAMVDTASSLCCYHGQLQQGYEVAWALWLAKRLGLRIPRKAAEVVANVDDDIVALVALDLRSSGLLPRVSLELWSSYLDSSQLYGEHWLLAYEACVQGWLPRNKASYLARDAFFSVLDDRSICFYTGQPKQPSGWGQYGATDVADSESLSSENLPKLLETTPRRRKKRK
jgi:hypothetical protein